jgi:hypothetical protein
MFCIFSSACFWVSDGRTTASCLDHSRNSPNSACINLVTNVIFICYCHFEIFNFVTFSIDLLTMFIYYDNGLVVFFREPYFIRPCSSQVLLICHSPSYFLLRISVVKPTLKYNLRQPRLLCRMDSIPAACAVSQTNQVSTLVKEKF